MSKLINRFWSEEVGAIVSAEVMLAATILVLGVIVGLKSVRDSVATELADVGQALSNVNQSYCYSGTSGHAASSGGGHYQDQADFCDNGNSNHCPSAKCVNVAAWGGAEGG
jgi:Flp pilus assembly pilin Flp